MREKLFRRVPKSLNYLPVTLARIQLAGVVPTSFLLLPFWEIKINWGIIQESLNILA